MIGYKFNDGGRADAGFKGDAGDCVARAIAILLDLPYEEARVAVAEERAVEFDRLVKRGKRPSGPRYSANAGVPRNVTYKVFTKLGLTKVKLPKGPCPTYNEAWWRYGDCIVSTNKHVCAIVGGYLCDTFDGREYEWEDPDLGWIVKPRKARMVWVKNPCNPLSI